MNDDDGVVGYVPCERCTVESKTPTVSAVKQRQNGRKLFISFRCGCGLISNASEQNQCRLAAHVPYDDAMAAAQQILDNQPKPPADTKPPAEPAEGNGGLLAALGVIGSIFLGGFFILRA